MNALVAGMATGALMASVFVTAGMFLAFLLIKDPSPNVAVYLARFPPGGLIMAIVVLSYPIWGFIGVILGVSLLALENTAPGGGLGTSNLTYSFGVLTAFPILAAFRHDLLIAPAAAVFRGVILGLATGVILAIFLKLFPGSISALRSAKSEEELS